MADIVDIGNDAAQAFLEDRLKEVRAGSMGRPGIGVCLNCGDPVEGDRRWCGAICRDDWEDREERRKQNVIT